MADIIPEILERIEALEGKVNVLSIPSATAQTPADQLTPQDANVAANARASKASKTQPGDLAPAV